MIVRFTVKSGYTILILIFINLVSSSVARDVSAIISGSSRTIIGQESAPQPCGFVGNSDIYGIGIRIGYYAQAISIWIANFFVLRQAKSLRAMNTLFMFAMVVGLVFLSASPAQTYSVEAYIMIQIIFAVWFVGTLDASKSRRRHWKFNFERTVIKNGSFVCMVIYNAWYWWVGLDLMQETPCGSFGFIFTKVALDGWYRKANMVLSILAISRYMVHEGVYLFRTLRYFYCRKINGAEYQGELQRRLESAMDVTASSRDCQIDQDACSHNQRSSTPASPHTTLDINLSPAASSGQELDTLAKSSPTSSPAVTTSKTKKNSDADWPDFQELHTADTYISAVLSACPDSSHTGPRFQMAVLGGAIKLSIPYVRPPPRGDGTVHIRTCLTTIFGALRRRQFNIPAVGILFSHIYALQSQPFYRYPWLLHRALTEPTHLTQSWRTLAIMTNIRFTRLPDDTKKWHWIPSAVQCGLVTVTLVVSIELTLWWNKVSNVDQIGTVGQMVPFVLGVGGLIKVLWPWVQKGFGTVHEQKVEEEVRSPESQLATAYYRLKEAYEGSMGNGTSGSAGHDDNV